MSATGEFFARLIMEPSYASNAANDARWLRVGKGAYLILRAFDEADSALVDEGLTNDSTFVFTDRGNVMFTDQSGEEHTYANPIDSTQVKDYNTRSLREIRRTVSSQYVYDKRKLISRNLRYILFKSTDERWYLLYNSLHTREFSKYYKHAINNASNVSWGATTENVAGRHINLTRVFSNYCDAFTVTHESGPLVGKKSYLDPVCNMIRSEHQAQRTALFDTALVCPIDKQSLLQDNCEYDVTEVNTASGVLSQLGAGDPKYCLCMGGVQNFVDELDDFDFIHDFEGRRRCNEHSLELNYCSVINKAENLNIAGSEMVTNCGGNVGAGTGTVGGGDVGAGSDTGGDSAPTATNSNDTSPIRTTDETLTPSGLTPLHFVIISAVLGSVALAVSRMMRSTRRVPFSNTAKTELPA